MFGTTARQRISALFAVVGLVAACASGGGSSPSPTVTPSAPPSVTPGGSPSAPPTIPSEPSVSPTVAPEVGLLWQRVDDPDLVSRPRNGSMYGVIAGGPGAIAWGSVYATGPRIWTTADGLDWSPATVEAIEDAEPTSEGEVLGVAAGGPGFVAVGSFFREGDTLTSAVWTSGDGIAWARVPDDAVFEHSVMDQVVAVEGGLRAYGCALVSTTDCGPSRVWTSTDGLTWEIAELSLPDGVLSIGSVVPAADRLWASGSSDPGGDSIAPEDMPQPIRLTSIDGLTWTASPLPVLGIEQLHPLPDGLYLTVADVTVDEDTVPPPAWVSRTAGLYRSTDAASWEQVKVDRPIGREVIAVGDTLVMVGSSGGCGLLDATCIATASRSTDGGDTWVDAPVVGALPAGVTRAWMSWAAALPDGTLVAVGTELTGGEPSTAAWVAPPRPGD